MCSATLARASLLLCLVVGTRQLSITQLVVPSTVQAGESAELACKFDRGDDTPEELFIKWFRTPVGEDRVQIYQGTTAHQGVSMRHVVQVKDNDTVVLPDAAPKDSGIYECSVSSLVDQTKEVQDRKKLTVFSPGTGPQLNISVVADGPDADSEEDVRINCRAEQVAPTPDLLLKINGEMYFNMTEDIIGPDAEGYYETIGTATLSKAEVVGATVTCELTYADTSISHPLFIATETYTSGTTTTESAEASTQAVITPDSLQNQSGDSTASRASWALLFVFSLLTQVPSLL